MKKSRRPKKKKFTVPFDVAMLVLIGSLMFLLFTATNWVCKTRENDDKSVMNYKLTYEIQLLEKGWKE